MILYIEIAKAANRKLLKLINEFRKLSRNKINTHKLPEDSTGDPTHDKVMWRRPDRQGGSGLKGLPGPARASTPNQNLSTVYYITPFTNSSDINRGLSPTTFL